MIRSCLESPRCRQIETGLSWTGATALALAAIGALVSLLLLAIASDELAASLMRWSSVAFAAGVVLHSLPRLIEAARKKEKMPRPSPADGELFTVQEPSVDELSSESESDEELAPRAPPPLQPLLGASSSDEEGDHQDLGGYVRWLARRNPRQLPPLLRPGPDFH